MPKLMNPIGVATDGYIIDLDTREWMYTSIYFKANILQNNYMTAGEKSASIVTTNMSMEAYTPEMTINYELEAKILCHI